MQSPGVLEVPGTLRIFGHDDTVARLVVLRRGMAWRGLRAGGLLLAGLVAAPVVALIPPHAAWALAAVITGLVLGGRKWAERFTLLSLEGPCPRCGSTIRVAGPTRLKNPDTVDCEGCHHGSTLTVPQESLARP